MSELTVTSVTEYEGWPCLREPEVYHKNGSDGECRTGFCFFASENTELTLEIRESFTYSYAIKICLLPGFNILSWCQESVLAYGGDYKKRFAAPTTPSFTPLLCCLGMSLTYQPIVPDDLDSPYRTSPSYKPKR